MIRQCKIFWLRRPYLVFSLLCIVLFAPFSNKAFHIDSNVTVYVSRQMTKNFWDPPLDIYGKLLGVWNHTDLPEKSVFFATPHPPLVPAYLVPFIKMFGENELALNWAMFPFYCASVLFFFGIAGQTIPRWRFQATLLFMVCPVVLINAQNVMLDAPMMAFSLASFYFMFQSNRAKNVVFSGVFAACACLTKSTAGTIVLSGLLYYGYGKKWRNCLLFLCPVFLGNSLWALHNIVFLGKIALVANGCAHYVLGDFRYRFERLLSELGGTIVFPLIPWVLFFLLKEYRRIAAILTAGAFVWAVLLCHMLHYSIPSAVFYAISASAGALLIYGIFSTTFKIRNNRLELALALQLLLQIAGGMFLGSYESRYMLPFVFIVIIFFARLVERFPNIMLKRVIWGVCLLSSAALSLVLSVADYQYAQADCRVAMELQKDFPSQNVYYFGRLGYLYYMDKAGFRNLSLCKDSLKTGDLLVQNCFSADDGAFFLQTKNLVLIKDLHYPLIPLRTLGGRSGFYGCDRLPFAWSTVPADREFKVYKFIGTNTNLFPR
jgi:hypothetical protein